MSARVLGLGNSCCDTFLDLAALPGPGGKTPIRARDIQPGGQVAGAMVGCARLGLRPVFLLRAGDDACGRRQLAALAAAGVDLTHARLLHGVASATAVILRDPAGERIVLWDTPAPLALAPDDVTDALVAASDLVYLDGMDGPACLRASRLARLHARPVVADLDCVYPHTPELLPLLDHLVVPQSFPATAPLPHQTVVVTQGPAGATAFRPSAPPLHAPAFPVVVRDSTGAGDAFHAAYVFALLRGDPLAARLRFANAAAALACTRPGAQAGLPTLAQVEAFLAGHR